MFISSCLYFYFHSVKGFKIISATYMKGKMRHTNQEMNVKQYILRIVLLKTYTCLYNNVCLFMHAAKVEQHNFSAFEPWIFRHSLT